MALVGVVAVSQFLVGCVSAAPVSTAGAVSVVAANAAWGALVAEIGGDHTRVTSLIQATGAASHDYQASVRDVEAVSNAQLVVVNGDGYDDFFDQLIAAAPHKPRVLRVADLGEAGQSEHYWYNFAAVGRTAQEIASRLSELDPAHASQFQSRAQSFGNRLGELTQRVRSMRVAGPSTALLTEALARDLVALAGFRDVTPPALSEAVENGSEIPLSAFAAALEQMASAAVDALVVTGETDEPQVARLVEQARRSGVAVLRFAEVPPAGVSYLDWMSGNVAQLERLRAS